MSASTCKQPSVSVIVPVYNGERYLSRCLDSLTGQTMKDIEIIVVNDGSTDGSGKILKKYAQSDDRIKVITQENMGVHGARNTGLVNSHGEYITFVDSDDYVEPFFCEALYKEIISTGSDVAICDYCMEYASKTVNFELGLSTATIQAKDMEPHIFYLRFLARDPVLWNKLYRRSIVQDNGIVFEVGYNEDLLFLFRLLPYIQKICTVAVSSYHYLQRQTSLMHSLKEIDKDSVHILNRYLEKPNNTQNNMLAYCAFASMFTGFAFSSYCIGRGVGFYYKQLEQFRQADFFSGFCETITKTNALKALYKERAVTKRFYRTMRFLFRCCAYKRYRLGALYWWTFEQFIILNKRAFLFDQIR